MRGNAMNRVLHLLVFAAAVLAVAGGCSRGPTALPADAVEVEEVEVELFEWRDQQKSAKVASRDAKTIEALLAALRNAEETKDHKCADSGRITLRLKDGGARKLGILAGHDKRHYEFREYTEDGRERYKIFRVEREPFLKAMQGLGATDLDPGRPE